MLYKKKLALEAHRSELSFAIIRDKLIYVVVTLITIITAVLFVCSPSNLFPKWYSGALISLLLLRMVDYFQKKEHFFLLDFCYTAGVQILVCILLMPTSVHLTTRCFAFGAGVLGWSTVILKNGLSIHRLDQFSSLWIHTIPALMVYSFRWTNENSAIYYQTYPGEVSLRFTLQYCGTCILPYALWVVGYYFIITKLFKNLTIEGDYMTLVKFVIQKDPGVLKLLDIFGPKKRNEAFLMFHIIYFIIVTTLGYVCFFSQIFHSICVGIWVLYAIWNGANSLVNDLSRPYEDNAARIQSIIAKLG